MQYVYTWDPGSPHQSLLKNVDPLAFADALAELEAEKGKMTAADLADAAKSKDHIAHEFIYHVGERQAARLHYETRARLMIRTLKVTHVGDDVREVRARISVVDDDGQRYALAQEVASNEALRMAHRASLLRRLNLIRRELADFDEFSEVVAAINRALEVA